MNIRARILWENLTLESNKVILHLHQPKQNKFRSLSTHLVVSSLRHKYTPVVEEKELLAADWKVVLKF